MDPDMKLDIDTLEVLANAPQSLAAMLPHERILADAIGRTAVSLGLTDIDLLTALGRITSFHLKNIIERSDL